MTNNLFSKLTESRRKVAATLANPATIGLWNLIVDKYSGKAHFVYELLQNADDAGARNVRLQLKGDTFYFIHDGLRHFSVSDVETEDRDEKIGDINALCSIGHSTKIGENKIGKFGIGFKSIFSYCDVPHVEDDNFSFDIENYIVPVESSRGNISCLPNQSGRRGGETMFCGKIKTIAKSDEIAAMVESLEYPLNYLNNVVSFECHINLNDADEKIYKFKKSIEESFHIPHSTFRIFNLIAEKTCNVETHGRASNKQYFICASESFIFGEKQMSATISMPLDGDGNVMMCDSSPLYCFFPLLEQSTLPFIVHGTFLLSDNRENTLQNEANNALRQHIASLSVKFLSHCLNMCKDARSRISTAFVLERLLEMKERCKYENVNSLNRLCSERLWQAIASEPFFADTTGAFLPTSELRFCIENVDEILNDDELVSLAGGNVCKDFVGVDLPKLPTVFHIIDSNITSVGVGFKTTRLWGIESLLSSFEESFIMKKSDGWLVSFYQFLYKEKKVVFKLLRGKSDAFTKPWIKCADGEFRSLRTDSAYHSASIYLSGDASHSVCPTLLEVKEINSLFTDVLHLTHFAEQSLSVDFVAQQLYEQKVQPLDYDTLAKYIMIAANEYVGAGFDFEKKKNIVEQFSKLQFLPTNKYILSLPKMVLAETAAQRTFFADDADSIFLPNEFIENHISPSDRQTFYTFISACGVCFDVRVDTRLLHHPFDYKSFGIADDDMPSPSKLKETEIEDKEIAGFDSFLHNPSLDKSLAFCRMLQSLLDKEVSTEVMQKIKGKYFYTPKGKRTAVITALSNTTAYRQLFQSRWLMKTNGDYASVDEIASTDMLMPAYDELPYSVFSFLGIALKKRDESAEAREALELIRALESVGITKDELRKMLKAKLAEQN